MEEDEYEELELNNEDNQDFEEEKPEKRHFFGIGKRKEGKHKTEETQITKDSDINPEAEIFQGLDSNPTSPKMVMELADQGNRNRSKAEKKALAQKTVGIRPIHNENIEHRILTNPVEKSVNVKAEIEGDTGEIPGQTRMAQALLSHFECSIHAALKFPK